VKAPAASAPVSAPQIRVELEPARGSTGRMLGWVVGVAAVIGVLMILWRRLA
jgi:nitrate reductase gamma subunit